MATEEKGFLFFPRPVFFAGTSSLFLFWVPSVLPSTNGLRSILMPSLAAFSLAILPPTLSGTQTDKQRHPKVGVIKGKVHFHTIPRALTEETSRSTLTRGEGRLTIIVTTHSAGFVGPTAFSIPSVLYLFPFWCRQTPRPLHSIFLGG